MAAEEAKQAEENALMNTISAGGAQAAGIYASGDVELSYATLLPLYIAARGQEVANPAFAWHYFQVYKAPTGEACEELQDGAMNPISDGR